MKTTTINTTGRKLSKHYAIVKQETFNFVKTGKEYVIETTKDLSEYEDMFGDKIFVLTDDNRAEFHDAVCGTYAVQLRECECDYIRKNYKDEPMAFYNWSKKNNRIF